MFQKTHQPLVHVSQAQAEHQLQSWLRENNFESLTDADGLVWKLTTRIDNHADPVNRRGSLLQATLDIECTLDVNQLIATQTFDPVEDERLLGLFSHRVIRHPLTPVVLIAENQTRLRTDFASQLVSLRQTFAKTSYKKQRQDAVRKTINDSGMFAHTPKDTITVET